MAVAVHPQLTARELARVEWLWEGPTAAEPRREEKPLAWDDMMERLARGELRPARGRARGRGKNRGR